MHACIYEQGCSFVRVLLIILSCLARLVFFFLVFCEVFPVTTTASEENMPLVLEKNLTKVDLLRSDPNDHKCECHKKILFNYYCSLKAFVYSPGKKLKSVFNFLTYSRETWFSFSYGKVVNIDQAIKASNEIDKVSKFDDSLSFGADENSLWQIFFKLWFFKDFFYKKFKLNVFQFIVGSIK